MNIIYNTDYNSHRQVDEAPDSIYTRTMMLWINTQSIQLSSKKKKS